MERDDIIIALARLQATQEEILRRFDDNKEITTELNDRVKKLEDSLAWIYGAIALAGFCSTFVWQYISTKMGWDK